MDVMREWSIASDHLPPEDLATIERRLHAEVANTKAAYQKAKDEADKLRAIAVDLGPGISDGRVALENAIRIERFALSRYTRAIEGFSRFVLDNKLPRDLP